MDWLQYAPQIIDQPTYYVLVDTSELFFSYLFVLFI